MISSIRLQNFRSYGNESFEFDGGVNIVVGPNASGKTNLLEAVLVLSRGSSYRGKDIELVKFGRPWARLDGFFGGQSRSLKLEKEDELIKKAYLIEDKPYKRINLDKTVPVVYFEPNHLQLISRGPDQRRDYFDDLLERSRPGFKQLANGYRRALAQRNALLKQGPQAASGQIFAWNVRLSEMGEKIAQARQELVEDINKNLSKDYSQISKHKTNVKLEYKSQFSPELYGSKLLRKLESHLQEDYQRGFTAYGPHREDFSAEIGGRPANIAASRGETRSLMLALKVYELRLIEQVRGQKPIFLLDDVFSELDGSRRRALVKFLEDRQIIITTTDADAVIDNFTQGHKLIAISPKVR